MNIVILILVTLVLLYIFKDCIETFMSRTYVSSHIDRRKYNIVGKFANYKDAPNKLAKLNGRTIELLRHLRRKYVWGKYGDTATRKKVKNLLKTYNPDVIMENAPIGTTNTSYVRNKGDVIAICLREKVTGQHKFHDDDTLQFVKLHELTHIFSTVYGHPEQFWRDFKFILKEAAEAGVYDPINYAQNPTPYCGVTITYNPYYDPAL